MHIAWCGPISLLPLRSSLREADGLPEGYVYPLGAYFVEELLRLGHEVTVVTTGGTETQEPARYAGDRLKVVVVPRRRPRDVARDFFRHEVHALERELRNARPDVVHAQWTYEFADAAIRSGLPVVVTARDNAPSVFWHFRDRYRFIRLLYSYYVVPRIGKLVVLSPYLAKEYQRWYLKRGCAVIPNGLNETCFADGAKRSAERQTTIVSITGWGRLKNATTLLRGFALARQRMPDLRLIVIGPGLEPEGVGGQWAHAHGLHHQVDFKGRLSHEHTTRILKEDADLFVHTTLHESFCMAVVEAMAAGVPVIAGRRSGAVPWLLGDGRHGTLVDVRSPAAVAEGILEVADNRDRARSQAQSAFSFARENFSLGRTVRSYLSVYQEALPKDS